MCVKFSRKLIDALAKRRMGAISVVADMNAIQEVFPNGDEKELKRRTYVFCIKQLMVDIAKKMLELFPGDQVLVVHESGNWDEEALRGYKLLADEGKWDKGRIFCGFTSLTKVECIGFEACDLIAYEMFKGVKAKTADPNVSMRGALQEMHKKGIAMSTHWINLDAAKALYRIMKASGKYPDLDKQGIT